MIDQADRHTLTLPLDEPKPTKRGRGRPSTGQALSNAERQRRYRENLKAQRNEKSGEHTGQYTAEQYGEVRDIAVELGERCKRAEERRDELHDLVQQLLTQRDQLIRECRDLKKELSQRNRKTNDPKSAPGKGVWTPRFKIKGSRTWVNCDPQVDFEGVAWSYEDTAEHVREMQKMQKSTTWQAVRDDGLIYDPKAAK